MVIARAAAEPHEVVLGCMKPAADSGLEAVKISLETLRRAAHRSSLWVVGSSCSGFELDPDVVVAVVAVGVGGGNHIVVASSTVWGRSSREIGHHSSTDRTEVGVVVVDMVGAGCCCMSSGYDSTVDAAETAMMPSDTSHQAHHGCKYTPDSDADKAPDIPDDHQQKPQRSDAYTDVAVDDDLDSHNH